MIIGTSETVRAEPDGFLFAYKEASKAIYYF